MSITLAHNLIATSASTSGSITIPSSGAGDLLVILADFIRGGLVHPSLTITDNVGDTFHQPSWPSLGNTDATPGQLYRFSGGTGNLIYYNDCWYATSKC